MSGFDFIFFRLQGLLRPGEDDEEDVSMVMILLILMQLQLPILG